MTRQRERDEFIALMTQEGVPVEVARTLMRHAATLHRVAELECSSEAADLDRVKCPQDGKLVLENGGTVLGPCLCRDYGSWSDETRQHGTVPRIAVREVRHQRRVETLLKPYGILPVFNGDPRGAVLKLKMPSGRTNDWGQEGVCVP